MPFFFWSKPDKRGKGGSFRLIGLNAEEILEMLMDIFSALGITYNFSRADYLDMKFSELHGMLERAKEIKKQTK